ncbi:MAG: hypothetical protein AB7P04_03845 [Bacteriovoracia bacterium]
MKPGIFILCIFAFLSIALGAAPPIPMSPVMAPDQLLTETNSNLRVQIVREDHGKTRGVIGLPIRVYTNDPKKPAKIVSTDAEGHADFGACSAWSGEIRVSALMENTKFSVGTGFQSYQIDAKARCGRITFQQGETTDVGQALAIWEIAQRAMTKLEATVGLDFWKRPIGFAWPQDFDFYDGYQVHLRYGHHWDVATHEMAHAIYDQAAIGEMPNYKHYIDRCHDETIAMAEGWAHFFAAWVNLDVSAADPVLEHYSPRRGPIHFETVPRDVCKGPSNEWRVLAYLWDIHDANADGETLNESFARTFKSIQGKDLQSIRDAIRWFKEAEIDEKALDALWVSVFQTQQ